MLNLINYSQMTANSGQIAYLSASLLDTSPASHPFSVQCTSTSFQSLFSLRNHSVFFWFTGCAQKLMILLLFLSCLCVSHIATDTMVDCKDFFDQFIW